MSTHTIAFIVGSLRSGSYARQIAREVATMLPDDFNPKFLEIGDLPLYNADYDDPKNTEKPLPEEYKRFRKEVKEADGVLFVTAENNRLVPACLKNAIDVGSKPNTDVAWTKLPAGIISHSVGRMGGYSAHKSLRLALSYFDMPITGQPEVFLGQSPTLLDADGHLNNKETKAFVSRYLDTFVQLVHDHPRNQ